jgi:hypothetical protein
MKTIAPSHRRLVAILALAAPIAALLGTGTWH